MPFFRQRAVRIFRHNPSASGDSNISASAATESSTSTDTETSASADAILLHMLSARLLRLPTPSFNICRHNPSASVDSNTSEPFANTNVLHETELEAIACPSLTPDGDFFTRQFCKWSRFLGFY